MAKEFFREKVSLVTGAGSGIGRTTAMAFAREGARVVVSDVVIESGQETVRLIKEAGGEAIFVQADVSKSTEVEAMVDEAVNTYGSLDCAFNNAGIAHGGFTIADYPEDGWDQVMAINLKGIFLCMKYEIPQMLKSGGGAIVNTSSVGGLVGISSGAAGYVTSKHGVIGLTKVAALDYAKSGIRVNAVCPGTVRTPLVQHNLDTIAGYEDSLRALHPMGRLAEATEIAEAVLWLCSDAASFVTGHALVIDGGRLAV